MRPAKIFSICVLLALIGYTPETKANAQSLTAEYHRYIQALDTHDAVELLSKFWAPDLVRQGLPQLQDVTPENELHRNSILFSLYFPNQAAKVSSIQETVSADTGCVLVIGLTKEKNPLAISISYALEQENWQISGVHLRYFQSSEKPISEPDCEL